ncbi:MAG: hypothetical protein GY791_14150 [Alphaproteobacteria bacterium]|nr:hypothetical protein [Alphaproteobacteria bacterium]
MSKAVRSLVLSCLLVAPVAATAEDGITEILEYRVLRDGDQIGSHIFTISQDQDQTRVNVKTDIEVRIAFITAFRFEHERDEVWRNGSLVSIESTTNDDGDEYTIKGWATDDGFLRNVNGRTDSFDNGTGLVSFWDRDLILANNSYFSGVVDETYDVSISSPSVETLWIDERSYDAEHYRMSGDLDYDLWYDSEGSPLKISFEKRGSKIDWILK